MWCFEQIQEATSHKTASARPLSSHLTNHPSKMNKTCWPQLEKKRQTHKQCSSLDFYIWAHECWLTSRHMSTLYSHRM